jgi:photosystem II stability/assembly factor-like uncharacterized protein
MEEFVVAGSWRAFPTIELPTPVLALTAQRGEVFAGGWGRVAGYTPSGGWVPLLNGLSLRSVTVLAECEGMLLAGGDGGVVRSLDGGQSWRRCLVPEGTGLVAALALSPRFGEDGVALAGTLGNGILRSTDGGQNWQTSNFGLGSADVLALAWGADEAVIAATDEGLFQSPNGGRAWRVIPQTAGGAFVALAAGAKHSTLAAPESGPLMRSTDSLANWTPLGDLPGDIQNSALMHFAESRILLGSADHGLLLSQDEGVSWSPVAAENVLGFAANESRIYAATNTGVLESRDGGETWLELPPPPLHDLRRLQIVDGMPLISGTNSPAVTFDANGAWMTLAQTPFPLIGLIVTPDEALFGSSPDGLFVSRDRGASWAEVIAGEEGCVTQMTFGIEGRGWAGITADGLLLRTRDGGLTWERLPSPFGVLPLVALQAVSGPANRTSDFLIAVTYDERQQTAVIWRTEDGGDRWARGTTAPTPWPVVPTCGSPAAVAVGNAITIQQPEGEWRQGTVDDSGLRRIASEGSLLFALGTDALWRSDDLGLSWIRDESGLPIEQTLDIALDAGTLYALLTAGRLWSRRL